MGVFILNTVDLQFQKCWSVIGKSISGLAALLQFFSSENYLPLKGEKKFHKRLVWAFEQFKRCQVLWARTLGKNVILVEFCCVLEKECMRSEPSATYSKIISSYQYTSSTKIYTF